MKYLIEKLMNKLGYYSERQIEEDIDATWDAAITWRHPGGGLEVVEKMSTIN